MKVEIPEEWKKQFGLRTVQGISIKCIRTGRKLVGWGNTYYGHAHTNLKDSNYGWICVTGIKQLGKEGHNFIKENDAIKILKPSKVLLHEYAHIITEKESNSHGIKWKETMRVLGCSVPRRYKIEASKKHR